MAQNNKREAAEATAVANALLADSLRYRGNGAGLISEAHVHATLAVAAHLGRIADALERDTAVMGLRRGGVED